MFKWFGAIFTILTAATILCIVLNTIILMTPGRQELHLMVGWLLGTLMGFPTGMIIGRILSL
jgi:hypothetical protein